MSSRYRPLAEITKNQPEFQLESVSGDLVGFRLPAYVKGINVPGWHLHFIADDRQRGGHVMGFELLDGSIEIDEVYDFRMTLPHNSADFNRADLGTDRSAELQQVEGKRWSQVLFDCADYIILFDIVYFFYESVYYENF
ncbi:MAG: acetolactate decarboxylase [Victivallaceae bacterium]